MEKREKTPQVMEYVSPIIEMVEVVCERGFASSPATEGDGNNPSGSGSDMPWG